MQTRYAVLGSGAWGTAVALHLARSPDHEVALWSAREKSGRELQARRENVRLLPGVPIPETIRLTTDVEAAVDRADLWISAVPTVYLRSTFAPLAACLKAPTPVLSLSKGVENETFLRPSEILVEILGPRPIGVLTGPSHAEEVSRGLPTTLVATSHDYELARWVQQCFSTESIRVYTSMDLIGVELGGALKNIVGVAAGISDGLGFGDNAKSALLTRGLVEMARFGVALGAEQHTFFGLSGLGDLITTCISPHGRNRRVGFRLGKGETLAQILQSMDMVAEGVHTTRSVYHKAAIMGIGMPITTEVYRVLYEQKDARAAVCDLMVRELKSERIY
jgi:glycerol-3-phosphate dehydrogenase (NAD(P)+)